MTQGWNGKDVIITDDGTVDSTVEKYTTYILGKGAIKYAELGVKVPYEMVRDAKTKGGETSLITRRRLTFSPVGISYVSNKTISPTKEELKKGENWEIVHNEEGKSLENVRKEFKVLKIDLTLTNEDIEYYLEETKQSILNKINSYKLPKELNHVLVKRTVGAIIELISTSGTLVINNEKIEDKNLKSITRGDVSMSYDGTSSISKTTELLNKFQNYGDSEILKFRIIRW